MIPVLGFLLFSCEFSLDKERPGEYPSDPAYTGLERRTFWAQDLRDNSFYQTVAVKLGEGEKCVIWGEESAKVSQDTAALIAKEYDDHIYTIIVKNFGMDNIPSEDGDEIRNSLEWADYITDNDKKLTILLLDIRDGYTKRTDAYTAGYFTSGNFYDHPRSNKTDMVYVDTYPSELTSQDSYATFAHELQHLINYINTQVTKRGPMDTWIDEGLSSAAEYMYTGDHAAMRYGWYIEDQEKTIAQGNNFFVWNNYPEKPNAILDEYATVYLFFQWLRLQSGGGYEIYKDIAVSENHDQQAVVHAASQRFQEPQYAKDWETLLRTWLAANYLNNTEGPYGYRNDPKLKHIRAHSIAGTQALLYPGEGVYSGISGGSVSPSAGDENIRYGGLSRGQQDGDFSGSPYSGEGLLTFNINHDLKGRRETGYLSGSSVETRADLSRQIQQSSGPFRIDARDLGNIREWERNVPFPFLGEKEKDAAQ
jgi:hypothetical protein